MPGVFLSSMERHKGWLVSPLPGTSYYGICFFAAENFEVTSVRKWGNELLLIHTPPRGTSSSTAQSTWPGPCSYLTPEVTPCNGVRWLTSSEAWEPCMLINLYETPLYERHDTYFLYNISCECSLPICNYPLQHTLSTLSFAN